MLGTLLASYLQHSWWKRKRCSGSPAGSHWRSLEYGFAVLIHPSGTNCPPEQPEHTFRLNNKKQETFRDGINFLFDQIRKETNQRPSEFQFSLKNMEFYLSICKVWICIIFFIFCVVLPTLLSAYKHPSCIYSSLHIKPLFQVLPTELSALNLDTFVIFHLKALTRTQSSWKSVEFGPDVFSGWTH